MERTSRTASVLPRQAVSGAELVREAFVWDNHACMPLRPGDDSFLPQLERLRSVGVNAVTLNVVFDGEPWHLSVKMLASFRQFIRRHADSYLLVQSVADLDRARREGKLAVMFDIEGGCGIDAHLPMIELFYDLGVRWMLIAYNRNNALGGGCQDDHSGLTELGRLAVREMERVGMVVCCSHTGHRTAMEVMKMAVNPVIISHSNTNAVYWHERNIDDDLIRACASTGGVIGVNGLSIFLGQEANAAEMAARHVDHIVNLVGPEHVGLGLDFVYDSGELDHYVRSNPALFPASAGYGAGIRMIEPEQIPEFVDTLLARNYTEDDLRMFLGGNHRRVADAVWK